MANARRLKKQLIALDAREENRAATEVADQTAAIVAGDAATLASANTYTDTKVADLIDSAPGTLDTLKEIADQLNADESAAAALTAALAAETAARAAADTAEATARANADTAEATARVAADTTLQGNIDAEATARAAADTTLQGNIDAEATTRAAADSSESTARSAADAAEAAARAAADAVIQAQVDALNALPPAQIVHVRLGGSDTTGNGSAAKPFATVQAAEAAITDATTSKQYTLDIGPGTFTLPVGYTKKLFIHWRGVSKETTVIASQQSVALTATTDGTTNVLTGLASTAFLTVGLPVTGTGIAAGSVVQSFTDTTVTLNLNTTSAATSSLTFGGNRSFTSVSTTSGSRAITGLVNTDGLYLGAPVSGTGIPTNSYVHSIDSATQISISDAATATGTITMTVGTGGIKILQSSAASTAGSIVLVGVNLQINGLAGGGCRIANASTTVGLSVVLNNANYIGTGGLWFIGGSAGTFGLGNSSTGANTLLRSVRMPASFTYFGNPVTMDSNGFRRATNTGVDVAVETVSGSNVLLYPGTPNTSGIAQGDVITGTGVPAKTLVGPKTTTTNRAINAVTSSTISINAGTGLIAGFPGYRQGGGTFDHKLTSSGSVVATYTYTAYDPTTGVMSGVTPDPTAAGTPVQAGHFASQAVDTWPINQNATATQAPVTLNFSKNIAGTLEMYKCSYSSMTMSQMCSGIIASSFRNGSGLTLSDAGTSLSVSGDAISGSTPTLNGGATLTRISNVSDLAYTPTTSADWDTQPTTGKEALDILAAGVNYLDDVTQGQATDISNLAVEKASEAYVDAAAAGAQAGAQSYADTKVEDTIADGETGKAPSQNAVFDALALKADASDLAAHEADTVAHPSILTFDSSPTLGGNAVENVGFSGMQVGDAILSLVQKTPGANPVPLLGWSNHSGNNLDAQWTADPGAGAVLRITIKR